jgi:hypothetical protein
VKQEILANAFIGIEGRSKIPLQRERTTKSTVWLLIPQFVSVKSHGYKQDARKYKINEFGIQLVNLLMEDAKKAAENPNTPEPVEEDDEEESEEEDNGTV